MFCTSAERCQRRHLVNNPDPYPHCKDNTHTVTADYVEGAPSCPTGTRLSNECCRKECAFFQNSTSAGTSSPNVWPVNPVERVPLNRSKESVTGPFNDCLNAAARRRTASHKNLHFQQQPRPHVRGLRVAATAPVAPVTPPVQPSQWGIFSIVLLVLAVVAFVSVMQFQMFKRNPKAYAAMNLGESIARIFT